MPRRSKIRFTMRGLMATIAAIALLLGLFLRGLSGDVAEFGGILVSAVGMLIVFVSLYFTLWFGALGLFWLARQSTARRRTARS